MFQTIVVPVDGSAFGELALPAAMSIACRTDGGIRVITVVTPLPQAQRSADWSSVEAERMSLAREHAQAYQQELVERVTLAGCEAPVSRHVEEGGVVEELDAHVRRVGADLLVMTTHGRGPLRRAWLGSVADGLVRHTPCPILAIRPREGERVELEEHTFSHILVPLDGSPESAEIFPYAKGMARLFGASMTLFRVIPPPFPLSSPYIPHAAQEMRAHDLEEEAAREALERKARELTKEGFNVQARTELSAHPAEAILELADAEDMDLVAMATHGRGGVSRLVLGSVADKVVRGGRAPVLLHRTS